MVLRVLHQCCIAECALASWDTFERVCICSPREATLCFLASDMWTLLLRGICLH